MGHEFIYFIPYDVKEPFEQREEIIRCCDCLYWEDEDYCLHWQTSPYEAPCTLPEDFCSYAERRAK